MDNNLNNNKNRAKKDGRSSNPRISGAILLAVSLCLLVYSGREFLKMHTPDILYPGPGVTGRAQLSDYAEDLKNSPGDTDIYILEGEQPGGSMLVLGGTHNDEISGQVSAITLIENAEVSRGTLYVIPRANNSGATYTQEMVGNPKYLELKTEKGIRKIRTGSRYANFAHQFPDPDVYENIGEGTYPGPESRNLNRVYPGRADGLLVEKVGRAIVDFVNAEKIDVVLDLHEAVPEHYVVNCMVGHDRAMEMVAFALMGLQMQGIDIKMYQSPKVYGFSHRGLGDHTEAMVVLAETTNIIQGMFRGKPTQELLQDGKDPFYDILARSGKIFVDYDSERGSSLSERVGRHLSTVMELTRSIAYFSPEKMIEITGVPEVTELMENGIERYLEPDL